MLSWQVDKLFQVNLKFRSKTLKSLVQDLIVLDGSVEGQLLLFLMRIYKQLMSFQLDLYGRCQSQTLQGSGSNPLSWNESFSLNQLIGYLEIHF